MIKGKVLKDNDLEKVNNQSVHGSHRYINKMMDKKDVSISYSGASYGDPKSKEIRKGMSAKEDHKQEFKNDRRTDRQQKNPQEEWNKQPKLEYIQNRSERMRRERVRENRGECPDNQKGQREKKRMRCQDENGERMTLARISLCRDVAP